jgi:uncharacterized protein (TIGR02611 family)
MRARYIGPSAPVAQWIRASGYGPEGRGFESLRACHESEGLSLLLRRSGPLGFLDRIGRLRERHIASYADEYLDEGEDIVHWVRARNVEGRGDGFIYLTERRCVIHYTSRSDNHGAATWEEVNAWGIARDTKGGPILGIETAEGESHFVQMVVTTPAMAQEVETFVERFADLAPDPGSMVKGNHIGRFEPRRRVEVERHPKTIRDQTQRILITILGVLLIVVGIIITPLPGPWSLPLIIAGLAILSSEYDWAKDARDWIREKSRKVAEKIKSRSRA